MRMLLLLLLALPAGSTPWTLHTIDNSSQGADGVRLFDVNQDGHLDIVTGWEEGGVVRVYHNPGPENAKEPWPFVEAGQASNVEDAFAVDLDEDGSADVISCSEGNTRRIHIHWAPAEDYWKSENWTTQVLPASEGQQRWMFAFSADVNRDGRMDIVAAGKNKDAQVGWFESPDNPRDLQAWQWHPLWDVGWVMSMIPHLDSSGNLLGFYLSNRHEPWRGVLHFQISTIQQNIPQWTATQYPLPNHETMFMALGTLHQSPHPTAFIAAKDSDHLLLPLNGHTTNASPLPLPPNTGSGKALALGDINLDGKKDLVFTCEHAKDLHGVMGYLQQGSLKSPNWVPFDIGGKTGTKFDRIELIDLDKDGDLDLLTCEEREGLGVIWYENPTR